MKTDFAPAYGVSHLSYFAAGEKDPFSSVVISGIRVAIYVALAHNCGAQPCINLKLCSKTT